RPAGADAAYGVLDRAAARIAAAVDQHDLLAAGAIMVGPPVGPMTAIVIAPMVRAPVAIAARRRVQQDAEIRPGLALDLGRDLGVSGRALRQGDADHGGGDDGYAGDGSADPAEGETGRHGSTPSLTALLRTGDLSQHGLQAGGRGAEA